MGNLYLVVLQKCRLARSVIRILYFANPKEPRATKTHNPHGIIRQIRQASTAADFNGELNLRSDKRFPQIHTGGFWRNPRYSYPRIGKPTAINAGCAHGLSLGDLGGNMP